MRTPIPFHHSDISAFARSLREALRSVSIDSLKHTDVLNILARTQGFSNFQALKASKTVSKSAEHMIVLKAVPSSFSELSGRISPFRPTHHQLEPTETLFFRLNVSIVLGSRCADIVLHIRASGKGFTFGPDYAPDEGRIWQAAISELADKLRNDEVRPFFSNQVDITLPECGTAGENCHHCSTLDVVVSDVQFLRLEYIVGQIEQAARTCQSVISWLRFVTATPEEATKHRAEVAQALDYIDAVARVSGDTYLDGWNAAKMADFRHQLMRCSEGKRPGHSNNEFRKLFPFKAPTAWIGTPPELTDRLRKLAETGGV